MATDFSTLVPDVALHAPGCSQPMALHYLRVAAVELCRRSSVWEEPLAQASVTGLDFPYTLAPTDPGTRISRVKEVFLDGIRLTPWTRAESLTTTPDWREVVGYPTAYLVDKDFNLRVVPALSDSSTAALDVTLALVPTWTAESLDDVLVDLYREGLVAGAVSRLCAIPGQSFTNLDLAAAFGALFRVAIGTAISDANQGFTSANSRVQFNTFV